MMLENPEHASGDNFIADGEGAAEIRREVYGNPKFVHLLKNLLPIFFEKNACWYDALVKLANDPGFLPIANIVLKPKSLIITCIFSIGKLKEF